MNWPFSSKSWEECLIAHSVVSTAKDSILFEEPKFIDDKAFIDNELADY